MIRATCVVVWGFAANMGEDSATGLLLPFLVGLSPTIWSEKRLSCNSTLQLMLKLHWLTELGGQERGLQLGPFRKVN